MGITPFVIMLMALVLVWTRVSQETVALDVTAWLYIQETLPTSATVSKAGYYAIIDGYFVWVWFVADQMSVGFIYTFSVTEERQKQTFYTAVPKSVSNN